MEFLKDLHHTENVLFENLHWTEFFFKGLKFDIVNI